MFVYLVPFDKQTTSIWNKGASAFCAVKAIANKN